MKALALVLLFGACAHEPREWWRDAVFYEIYPRSFADTNGDGVGDLAGITRRLDYLAELGIDAIWITPFYPSPQVDFGYDVSDYTAVDPQFGTLADFDRLIAEAHRRNIRVVVDLVLNHTSDRHPWFVDSRSSRDSSHRDFYIWRDGRDGGPPNNWSSVFGPEAWTFDAATKQYYYHQFYPEQPDLDWRNPAVERAMDDVVRFWMGRGADGFRLDAVPHLYEDPALHDNPVLPALRAGSSEHEQDHRYDRNLPENHDALKRLRRVADPALLISEAYTRSIDDLVRYYGDGDEVQLPFNFLLADIDKLDASRFRTVIEDSERALHGRPTTWPLSNHDLPRAVSRFGNGKDDDAIAKLLAVMLLTLRGAPFLYYGEEIGMHNRDPRTIDEVRDPIGRRYWPANKGRDGERTPMQWTPSGGFTTGKPWLPMANDGRSVEAQLRDPDSILSLYKRAIALRRRTPALRDGSYQSFGHDPDVLAYFRGGKMLVVLNFSAQAQSFALPAGGAIVLSSVRREGQRVAGAIALLPFEAAVVQVQ